LGWFSQYRQAQSPLLFCGFSVRSRLMIIVDKSLH
jgi:hypothetical protein